MRNLFHFLYVLLAPAVILSAAADGFGDSLGRLWQIGREDDVASEFRHAPAGYPEYDRDGFFLVGRSEPSRDWPYCHPGPVDGWAGGRAHAFRIYFGLRERPASACRLLVDLMDTHAERPPTLTVTVNGMSHTHRCPPGGGDDAIRGKPQAGKEHRFAVRIPAARLKAGLNEIRITNADASWVVYDAVAMDAPAGTLPAPAEGALLESVTLAPWLSRKDGRLSQEVRVTLLALGGEKPLEVRAGGRSVRVTPEEEPQSVTLRLPPVDAPRDVTVTLARGLATLDARTVRQRPGREREVVDYVDCLIGTSTSRWMLYPGPSMPFGMVKLSPDNQGHDPARPLWKAGYEYAIENVMGFSHVHAWTMGGLLTMPTVGPLVTDAGPEGDPDAGYRSRIRHETETAVPGYYAVTLEDTGVRAELTATTRAGLQRYTFPESRQARILIDLLTPTEYGKTVLDAKVRRVSETEVEGYAKMKSGWGASRYQEYVLHFVARTNKPFRSMDGWVGDKVERDVKAIAGKGDVGAALNFVTAEGEAVLLQTGISLVSIEQARLNLETEMKPFGWDFDACRAVARKAWQDLLSRIEVEGGSETDKVKFYTNLYRAYCARTIWSDVDGKYVDMYEKVQRLPDADSPVYGCDAFWNTFWNLNQLWNLVTPDVSNTWVRSLLEIYDKGGWLAKGPTGIEYSSIMVASHEIPFIVAAYQHGIRDYDAEKALEAMVHCQTTPGRAHEGGGHVGNRHLGPYLEHGYIPLGKGHASNTLEYAYDDWCVAQMAKALGRDEAYATFSKRAEYWRNLFDKESGFMRPRHPDGRWLEDFDPYSRKGGWVEGNPWQYTWFVPQNVLGLVEAMGRRRFVSRLNEGMTKSAETNFNATGDRMADFPINHGNQPSMQVAYLFNYAGAPWLTQKWARAIMDRYYGDDPIDGWPGDEDQGQGGAWFVMSALGLFQTDGGCRARPIYEIGSPLFDRATIHLDPRYYPGKTFTIEARNNGPRNVYVQSATLDGKPLERPWFYQSDLADGGTLVLEMGPEPNKAWGAGLDAAPPPTVPAWGKE